MDHTYSVIVLRSSKVFVEGYVITMKVGFIGLGRMGKGMALRVLDLSLIHI